MLVDRCAGVALVNRFDLHQVKKCLVHWGTGTVNLELWSEERPVSVDTPLRICHEYEVRQVAWLPILSVFFPSIDTIQKQILMLCNILLSFENNRSFCFSAAPVDDSNVGQYNCLSFWSQHNELLVCGWILSMFKWQNQPFKNFQSKISQVGFFFFC